MLEHANTRMISILCAHFAQEQILFEQQQKSLVVQTDLHSICYFCVHSPHKESV